MKAQAQTLATDWQARVGRIPPSVRTLAERSTPAEIRLDIQKLLQQDQHELAQALGDSGLTLYPNSEDMVGICALLAMSRSDWTEALELLRQLQEIQGDHAPATTHWLIGRCQRCMGEGAAAIRTLEDGLRLHPTSTELQTELTLTLQAQD